MLSSIYRVFIQRNVSFVSPISSTHEKLWCHFHLKLFCSASGTDIQKPSSEIIDSSSYFANYLIKKFGFSQEKAFTAAKWAKYAAVEKSESVIVLLKNQGLTAEQIDGIVRFCPQILLCDPEKMLSRKIKIFRSLGISKGEVNCMLVTAPLTFKCSLERRIMPCLNYIKSLFESSGTSFRFTQRLAVILSCRLKQVLIPNIEILRDAGVPDSRILFLLQYQPRALMLQPEKFRKVVDKVKQMNFSPAQWRFVSAVHVFTALSKPTWDKKVAAYKKWGWSEHDTISAFERNPNCITLSTGKITAMMDFLVNKMGIDSSFVVKRPDILLLSIEKRMKPRGSIYRTLLAKGLIEKDYYINSMFSVTEAQFLKKLVSPYEKEVPGLLQLYKKELDVTKS